MKYWRQRLHKSSPASHGSREISESIAGSLSWNLNARRQRRKRRRRRRRWRRRRRSPLRMKISGTLDGSWNGMRIFHGKDFMKTWTKSASDSPCRRAWTAEVNWKLACYEREAASISTRRWKFLLKTPSSVGQRVIGKREVTETRYYQTEGLITAEIRRVSVRVNLLRILRKLFCYLNQKFILTTN